MVRAIDLFGVIVVSLVVAASAGAQDTHENPDRGLTITIRTDAPAGAPAAQTIRLYSNSHALIIGIDDYTNGWPRLSNAVSDAQAVATALAARGFNVTLRLNLKSQELKDELERFFILRGEDPDARLFVWYAGHGESIAGEGFLVPADAPVSRNEAAFRLSALAMRRFGEFIRQAKSAHVLTIFDSCFAGTIFSSSRDRIPPAITLATARPVRQFLSAGDAGLKVTDDGLFRRLFLGALSGDEAADANGDGYLTGTELGFFLEARVTNLTEGRQTPRYGKLRDPEYDRGDFICAIDPNGTESVQAPSEAASPAPQCPDRAAFELLFWQAIQNSTRPADFEAYLEKFPKGVFAGLAWDRLGELEATQTAAVVPPPQLKPAPTVPPAVGVYPGTYRPGQTFKDCDVCPEMVVVPAGAFRMGDLNGGGTDDEKPVHAVTMPQPFAMGVYEVTFAEWDACVSGGGCNGYRPHDLGWGRGKRPVIHMNWKDAKAYVAWLSRETGERYRLLSESEWEYAARAGTTTKYHWGNSFDNSRANISRPSMITGTFGASGDKTVPVGGYAPNEFGLHDVHGNVSEWVEDCWHGSYEGAP